MPNISNVHKSHIQCSQESYPIFTRVISLNYCRFSLDTPVKDITSDFHLIEWYRQENTLVRDLLAHRTGIPDSLYNWLLGEVTTREDIVRWDQL